MQINFYKTYRRSYCISHVCFHQFIGPHLEYLFIGNLTSMANYKPSVQKYSKSVQVHGISCTSSANTSSLSSKMHSTQPLFACHLQNCKWVDRFCSNTSPSMVLRHLVNSHHLFQSLISTFIFSNTISPWNNLPRKGFMSTCISIICTTVTSSLCRVCKTPWGPSKYLNSIFNLCIQLSFYLSSSQTVNGFTDFNLLRYISKYAFMTSGQ